MCSFKTMMKMALGIGLLLIIGYLAFPAFQTRIAAAAPLLFVLLCPLSMIFMMKGMNHSTPEKDKKSDHEN